MYVSPSSSSALMSQDEKLGLVLLWDFVKFSWGGFSYDLGLV